MAFLNHHMIVVQISKVLCASNFLLGTLGCVRIQTGLVDLRANYDFVRVIEQQTIIMNVIRELCFWEYLRSVIPIYYLIFWHLVIHFNITKKV